MRTRNSSHNYGDLAQIVMKVSDALFVGQVDSNSSQYRIDARSVIRQPPRTVGLNPCVGRERNNVPKSS